jgi:SET domain-containing protein
MLLIETFVAASRFHGIGLFPKDNVEAGTIIFKYRPKFDLVINLEHFDQFPELTKEFIKKQAFKRENNYLLFGDDARFINHSKQNNLQFFIWRGLCIAAMKDISASEELLLDYSQFDAEQYKKINNLVERRDSKQWPPKIPLERLH